ncbi:DNA polymerase III subunit delta [Candidatus Vallotia cooleyia]|uniref:DNA polymerase III subunit delta n=1 Tax=Candidatus Vallotiella adelgis TaxID=1177211 RepID=UPI001D029950|nr:DNA polymerase III subunit delta [Candidatus Vallotia cooleyia]UDG82179.1 DNA polymerase III subunit delta [Candidatus Vallotia cooleyia]
MQLRIDALDSHLAKTLSRLYVVYGDEPLLIQEVVAKIRSAARSAGFTERKIFSVERSFDWSLLFGAAQSMSLFGERKLIELRISTSKISKDSNKALQALTESDNSDVLILIELPRLDTVTQKTAWFTALLQAGVVIRIDAVECAQLPNWIAQRLAAQQQYTVTGDEGRCALQFIAERVEGNLLAANQEIQKLGLLYPAGELTLKQIRDAVMNVARYNVFKLNEAMLAGDIARLARMLDGLRGEGTAPVLVLWAIVEEIRTLVRIKRGFASGKSLAILIRENRVWGARKQLIGPALKRLDEHLIEQALALAALLDRQVKGLFGKAPDSVWLLPADPWSGLFDLAMIVARPDIISSVSRR